MCSRCYNFHIKPNFCFYLFCKVSNTGTRHDQLLEHFSWISKFINQFVIPVLCFCIYQLTCCCLCILTGFLACKKIMEIIRYMKHSFSLFQIFRMFCLHSHQLIYRVENCFLDTGTCIKILKRNCLIYFLIHAFISVITISYCISKNLVVLIHQYKVNAPGINAHAYRNLADLFTFLKAILNFLEKSVKLPAKLAVFLYHSVLKTMNFLKLHFSILKMSKDQTSAGSTDIYC